jgi:hypothetical protein
LLKKNKEEEERIGFVEGSKEEEEERKDRVCC